MAGSSYKRIESSAKTLQVLDYIVKQKGMATVKDISEGLGISTGTLMTHLVTLEDEGWIQKVGDVYRLTLKMAIGWARTRSTIENEIQKRQQDLDAIS